MSAAPSGPLVTGRNTRRLYAMTGKRLAVLAQATDKASKGEKLRKVERVALKEARRARQRQGVPRVYVPRDDFVGVPARVPNA